MHINASQKMKEKDDDSEISAFKTYHVLVHMADFEGIPLSSVGKYIHSSSNA